MEKISVNGNVFTDESGRECILNGVNICDKQGSLMCKYTFTPFRDRSVIKKYHQHGFDILRLGFTWSAVEPEPNQYNEKFLDDISDIMDCAAENDIRIILDMHQDLYSDMAHWGDGAPAWATLSDGYKAHQPISVWAEGYFYGKAVHRAFDNFWNNAKVNGKGLQDYYADMWRHVAERFKDKPALFGYDLLNEPFPGTSGGKVFRKIVANAVKVTLTDKRLKKSELVCDTFKMMNIEGALKHYSGDIFEDIVRIGEPEIKEFDISKYTPFLNKISSAIREVTDNGIIFIDSCYYCNLGIPTYVGRIEVNGKQDENVCYAPHSYDLTVDTPEYRFANSSRVNAMFAEHKRAQERLKVPVLVGEWGGMAPGTSWLDHIEFLLDLFDKNKWSNTYWHFSPKMFDKPVCRILTRPYPKAVTGHIDSYCFDRDASEFTLQYTQNEKYKKPTEIFLPTKPVSVTVDGKMLKTLSVSGIPESEACVLSVKTDLGEHTVICKI